MCLSSEPWSVRGKGSATRAEYMYVFQCDHMRWLPGTHLQVGARSIRWLCNVAPPTLQLLHKSSWQGSTRSAYKMQGLTARWLVRQR